MKLFAVVLSTLVTIPLTESSPRRIESCAEMTYESRSQIANKELPLGKVEGVVQDRVRAKLPKACVGVFSEDTHKLLVATETDDKGRFSFPSVSKGTYFLVVKYPGFCPANARTKVSGGRGKSATVQMILPGLDDCSYIEAK